MQSENQHCKDLPVKDPVKVQNKYLPNLNQGVIKKIQLCYSSDSSALIAKQCRDIFKTLDEAGWFSQ